MGYKCTVLIVIIDEIWTIDVIYLKIGIWFYHIWHNLVNVACREKLYPEMFLTGLQQQVSFAISHAEMNRLPTLCTDIPLFGTDTTNM